MLIFDACTLCMRWLFWLLLLSSVRLFVFLLIVRMTLDPLQRSNNNNNNNNNSYFNFNFSITICISPFSSQRARIVCAAPFVKSINTRSTHKYTIRGVCEAAEEVSVGRAGRGAASAMPDKVRKMAYIIGLLAVSSVYWPIGGNTSQAIHSRLCIVYVRLHVVYLWPCISLSHALSSLLYAAITW